MLVGHDLTGGCNWWINPACPSRAFVQPFRRTNMIPGTYQRCMAKLMLTFNALWRTNSKEGYCVKSDSGRQIQRRGVGIMSRLGHLTDFLSLEDRRSPCLSFKQPKVTFVPVKVWEAEHLASKLGLQKTGSPSFCLAWNSGRTGSCLILGWTCRCTISPQTDKISFTPHDRGVQAFGID